MTKADFLAMAIWLSFLSSTLGLILARKRITARLLDGWLGTTIGLAIHFVITWFFSLMVSMMAPFAVMVTILPEPWLLHPYPGYLALAFGVTTTLWFAKEKL